MIQIISLRYYTKKDGTKGRTNKLITEVESLPRAFKECKSIVGALEPEERYNLFYTIAHCKSPDSTNRKLRIFDKQDSLPFDLDGIDLSKLDAYSEVLFEITKLDPKKTGQICSGNGLQFIALINNTIENRDDLKLYRLHYKAICDRINDSLKEKGLPGNADYAVYKDKSLMRFPGTKNVKEKGTTECVMRQPHIEEQVFDWHDISKLENVAATHELKWNEANNDTVDAKEITDKCEFIKWLLESPGEVREPHFYAGISIIARMPDGRERVHALHQSIINSGSDTSVATYTPEQVDRKIDNSLASSGPRSKKGIEAISDKCRSCPLKNSCKSPILLKAESFIATKTTGFHRLTAGGKAIPEYGDLRKHFDEKHPHIAMLDSGLIYRYQDGHYKFCEKNYIMCYAHEHFRPECTTPMANEFYGNMVRTNPKPSAFFNKTSEGFLNLANGVLELATGKLHPHSPEFGFRYKLNHEYDPQAKAPHFEAFLNDIMEGDQEKIKILEEFGGYALSGGRYKYHKFLMLTGKGRNGKGTYVDVLEQLAGTDNYASVPIDKMNNENNLQLLEGKLFNFSDEVNSQDLKRIGIIKKMTGEGRIMVKMMYHQPYATQATAKLIMSCNELPYIPETNMAIRNRLLLVEFNKTYSQEIGNIDYALKDRLRAELPGILNILIKGYQRLEKQGGFTYSKALEAANEEYMVSNNPVLSWFKTSGEIIEKPLNGRCTVVTTQDAFEAYSQWALSKGEKALNYRSFSQKFPSAFSMPRERHTRRTIKVDGKNSKMGVYYDLVLQGATRNPDNLDEFMEDSAYFVDFEDQRPPTSPLPEIQEKTKKIDYSFSKTELAFLRLK